MGFVYARKGNVVVTVATDLTPTGDPPAIVFRALGCLSGDVVVPRSFNTETSEDDNWCVSESGAVQQVSLGSAVIEPTFTVEMDPSLAVYDDMNEGFGDKDLMRVKFVATDAGGNKHELEYEGYFTQSNITFRGAAGATSQVAWTFHVNTIVTDEVTPA